MNHFLVTICIAFSFAYVGCASTSTHAPTLKITNVVTPALDNIIIDVAFSNNTSEPVLVSAPPERVKKFDAGMSFYVDPSGELIALIGSPGIEDFAPDPPQRLRWVRVAVGETIYWRIQVQTDLNSLVGKLPSKVLTTSETRQASTLDGLTVVVRYVPTEEKQGNVIYSHLRRKTLVYAIIHGEEMRANRPIGIAFDNYRGVVFPLRSPLDIPQVDGALLFK